MIHSVLKTVPRKQENKESMTILNTALCTGKASTPHFTNHTKENFKTIVITGKEPNISKVEPFNRENTETTILMD